MKEKVIEIIEMYRYSTTEGEYTKLTDEACNNLAEAIDTLYQEEIDRLKEIIQAQDVLNKVYAFTDIIEPPGEDNIMKLKKKIAELKQEAGL